MEQDLVLHQHIQEMMEVLVVAVVVVHLLGEVEILHQQLQRKEMMVQIMLDQMVQHQVVVEQQRQVQLVDLVVDKQVVLEEQEQQQVLQEHQ
ncbi:MAG: hypothetical protein CME98_23760 [Hyphomonas sp.]|nr:hypothetical protein [Hyphomonas sp.]